MTEKLRQEFEAWANKSDLFEESPEWAKHSECYILDEHNIAFDAWVHATDAANNKFVELLSRLNRVQDLLNGIDLSKISPDSRPTFDKAMDILFTQISIAEGLL